MSIKGRIGGGINEAFAKHTDLQAAAVGRRGAAELRRDHPARHAADFAQQPAAAGVTPTGGDRPPPRPRRRKPEVRVLRHPPGRRRDQLDRLQLLHGAGGEDLAGPRRDAAVRDRIRPRRRRGQPGELDNIALSSLTLIADTHKLYQMRYVDLPQSFFISYAQALNNAVFYDSALISHLDDDRLARAARGHGRLPAALRPGEVVAGERRDRTNLLLVAAHVPGAKTLRRRADAAPGPQASAKAAGTAPRRAASIKLKDGTPAEIERIRSVVRRRYLRAWDQGARRSS